MSTPKILLVNDDGISSPGLKAAAEAAISLGEATVMAPLHQQTAMGRARTGKPEAQLVPLAYDVHGQRIRAFSCEASPAAVVAHGLRVFTDYVPSLLISGINYGENIGVNASGSGTVGAALEAACRGIPALAVSLETPVESHFHYTEEDWSVATYFTRYFAKLILAKGLPPDVHILKVEVPAGATTATPWKPARLTPYEYYQGYIPAPTPQSARSEVEKAKRDCANDAADTDGYVMSVDKVVAVTPLSIDFTSRIAFPELRSWLEGA